MPSFAFDLKGVTKSFRLGSGEVSVLKDIDLQIPVGEFVAVIGPSGSGKSTLMHLLGCLDTPTSGTLSVLDHTVSVLSDDDLSALRCRSMGFVFQSFHLLPCYDAVNNVVLGMVYGQRPNRYERAKKLLEELGLGHRLFHRPRTLSGGEQQRVAIARAIANDPQIILADEPTGALDQTNGHAILELFDEFHQQGKTIILVTHDPNVAHRAERIIEMVDGRIHKDHRRGASS